MYIHHIISINSQYLEECYDREVVLQKISKIVDKINKTFGKTHYDNIIYLLTYINTNKWILQTDEMEKLIINLKRKLEEFKKIEGGKEVANIYYQELFENQLDENIL